MVTSRSKFDIRLRELRLEKELTVVALAQRVGINESAIRKWENKSARPILDYVILLADFFGVSVDYIAGIKDE